MKRECEDGTITKILKNGDVIIKIKQDNFERIKAEEKDRIPSITDC